MNFKQQGSESNRRIEPIIIQGGMGVGVSGWRLAKAVSLTGQLGVVSGTALDVVLVRRLQEGDRGGHLRRALAQFPLREMAERIVDRYFLPEGKPNDAPYVALNILNHKQSRSRQELILVANFAEVHLAKERHEGLVGINYLEKIQLPILPSLFGALLAGVDYVLMGAGIPASIPGIIDGLCRGQPVQLPLRVEGAAGEEGYAIRFNPSEFMRDGIVPLRRPKFLPIVASASLAAILARKSSGSVDGFVVEGPTAGGHNAPPRGVLQLNDRGEPIYGKRDQVDLQAMRDLGLPFWLAGSYGSPEKVVQALEMGAAGVQVGTAFAFCDESGLSSEIRRTVLRSSQAGETVVRTDPLASPTGFPFKVLNLLGTLSEQTTYQLRKRVCDLGFLRQAFRRPDGTLGWRCPAEPENTYGLKGGAEEETVGRKCICNGLMANIGLGQVRNDKYREPPIVTCGDDVKNLFRFLKSPTSLSYSARDVVAYLLSLIPKLPAASPV